MVSKIVRTDIEIISEKRELPYFQLMGNPKKLRVLSIGSHRFKSRKKMKCFEAYIDADVYKDFKEITYRLIVNKDTPIFQAKTWFKTPFQRTCIVETPQTIHKINCQTKKPMYKQKHWESIEVFVEKPAIIGFKDFRIEILIHNPFYWTTMQRNKHRTRLEFALVWCRELLEEGEYIVKLKIHEANSS